MWILGDDGLAINLDKYDRLDIKVSGNSFDVVAIKDERHIFGSDAVMTYRIFTFGNKKTALRCIKEITEANTNGIRFDQKGVKK